MPSQLAFAVFAIITVVAAWRVVTSPNVVRSALALVVVLAGMAPLFVMLAAEFLAVVQILVYVGAVVVLLLFGIMLTRSPSGGAPAGVVRPGLRRIPAAIAALALFVVLWTAIRDAFGDEPIGTPRIGRTADVGSVLLRSHVIPFEAISVLLLAALVGAVVLARRD
jgi:NADH-quinone oxidoreductase subunit J